MKTYAFIDSQNLNLGVLSLGWKLDFSKFREYLRAKYKVEKAFLCIGYVPRNKRLYTYLETCGYILIFKPTIEDKKHLKEIKGNVDAELVLHTMIEYLNYEKAIIVSGDGDFYCLIKYLHEQKKLGKVITPNRRYSSLLKEYGSYISSVDLFKEKVCRE